MASRIEPRSGSWSAIPGYPAGAPLPLRGSQGEGEHRPAAPALTARARALAARTVRAGHQLRVRQPDRGRRAESEREGVAGTCAQARRDAALPRDGQRRERLSALRAAEALDGKDPLRRSTAAERGLVSRGVRPRAGVRARGSSRQCCGGRGRNQARSPGPQARSPRDRSVGGKVPKSALLQSDRARSPGPISPRLEDV